MSSVRVFEHIACTACGCVCDDIRVHVDDDRIIAADNACPRGEPFFLDRDSAPSPASINGVNAPLPQAIERAAAILRAAKSPLIYGLSRSTTEGQRAALALAEAIGATIDTTAATGHAPSLMALQQVGESTCTLGEVKQRADLVIFWGCDPVTSHPRHIDRYAPARPGRTMVVVDIHPTPTALLADQFLSIDAGSDWKILWQLRSLLRGLPVRDAENAVRELAERMRSTRFGVVFFGGGLVKGPNAHRNVEALLQLVTDLNDQNRFYARRMRRLGDVAGADSVLTWQTGYPFGVNFFAGYPRYNPGEFSAPAMLARGEVDACLFVGSETSADFPPEALSHLRTIPVIALETPRTTTMVPPTVRFTTAIYGIHRPGTAYRMDEVPIPLRVLLSTEYPSDCEILEQILAQVNGSEHPPIP